MKLKNFISNKKTKGFTLIEIIVAIILLAVIGTSSVVGINYAKDKSKEKKIEKTYSQFDNALDVYLSNHPEVYENLENNVEGAVVTLEVLKNEGLVKDGVIDPITKEKIDYKNNYYVLSDAVLLENPTGSTEDVCNGQVGLNVLKSWKELSDEIETAEVIYICPKKNEDSISEELINRIEALEKLTGNIKNIYKGENSNNFVEFPVDNSCSKNDKSCFPTNESNLWRIYNYYGSSGDYGNIKLVYDKPIVMNQEYENLIKTEETSNWYYWYICNNENNCDSYSNLAFTNAYSTNCVTYNNKQVYIIDNEYYALHSANTKRSKIYLHKYNETVTNELDTFNCKPPEGLNYTYSDFSTFLNENEEYPENSLKRSIYDKIISNSWIDKVPYYIYYSASGSYTNAKLDKTSAQYSKLGLLNTEEILSTLENGGTWLNYYLNNIIGRVSLGSDTWYAYPSLTTTVTARNTSNSYYENGYTEYIPVITLKQGVKIVDNPNCDTDGSRDCPKLLEYNG